MRADLISVSLVSTEDGSDDDGGESMDDEDEAEDGEAAVFDSESSFPSLPLPFLPFKLASSFFAIFAT